ncbi:uncharacterized protein TNCV_850121 [Trichonephila clavipes]|uniref:Uncharacterized protein n=1 Tax=Trichonephila clavipes TaxID=2585209 RepID=A0A8X6VBG8_TRICX|nr:uncharacterized protein TNCV_850121 [Trichonephila clavipes]
MWKDGKSSRDKTISVGWQYSSISDVLLITLILQEFTHRNLIQIVHLNSQSEKNEHQDGRIRVWRHRGERKLAAFIDYRHIDPSPGVMVCGAIGYTSWSPLVHIDDTLNSARYISGGLRSVALPFIRAG